MTCTPAKKMYNSYTYDQMSIGTVSADAFDVIISQLSRINRLRLAGTDTATRAKVLKYVDELPPYNPSLKTLQEAVDDRNVKIVKEVKYDAGGGFYKPTLRLNNEFYKETDDRKGWIWDITRESFARMNPKLVPRGPDIHANQRNDIHAFRDIQKYVVDPHNQLKDLKRELDELFMKPPHELLWSGIKVSLKKNTISPQFHTKHTSLHIMNRGFHPYSTCGIYIHRLEEQAPGVNRYIISLKDRHIDRWWLEFEIKGDNIIVEKFTVNCNALIMRLDASEILRVVKCANDNRGEPTSIDGIKKACTILQSSLPRQVLF